MTDTDKYIQELKTIAEQMHDVASVAESAEFQEPVDAVDRTIDSVHKSWSGSNIGYHARVYYEGYQPPPTDDMFDKSGA
jgi:hypothetical protein